jgi:uncharacterized LabA/DUF88 family protein
MDSRQERVMIFIDGSNMYHSLKAFFSRTDIDLGKFCAKLIGKRRLIRIYYYNARVGRKEEPERYLHQRQFFDSVAAIPYTELRLGRLVYSNWPNSPPYEKGVDVQLATDMLTHSYKNNYDTAILVAGDNDFVSALQAVKDNGKHIEVALFGQEETSRELRRVADMVIPIAPKLLLECWKAKQPQKRGGGTRRRRLPVRPGQEQPANDGQQPQTQPSVEYQPQAAEQQPQPNVIELGPSHD